MGPVADTVDTRPLTPDSPGPVTTDGVVGRRRTDVVVPVLPVGPRFVRAVMPVRHGVRLGGPSSPASTTIDYTVDGVGEVNRNRGLGGVSSFGRNRPTSVDVPVLTQSSFHLCPGKGPLQ